MGILALLLVATAVDPGEALAKKMLPIYVKEIEAYALAAKTGVVDGAVFALVSEAGTDPEVLLVIEAREDAGKLQWEYACGRFSDCELHVQRKGKEVFTSLPSETNPFAHDPKHTYRIYGDKIMTPEGKLIARIRQTPKGPQFIPVEDK